MLLRVSNLRGLDLDIFDFDYDLTWAALFLSPDGTTHGRYGTRSHEPSSNLRSAPGLRFAMTRALDRHRQHGLMAPKKPGKRPEDYASSARIAPKGCIHCHNIHEFRREERQKEGTWKTDLVWVFPEAGNIGLSLDVDQGNRVVAVKPDSPADRAGLTKDDVLVTLAGKEVASFADVQYALNGAPAEGDIPIVWQRGGKRRSATLTLAAGWRVTDLSWRWSMKTLPPFPSVDGVDLTVEERKRLGLPAQQLAFRQSPFVSQAARHAGLQINDVITGVDDRPLAMKLREFDIFIRLNYKVGDVVHLNVMRGQEKLRLPLKLP